MGAHGCPPCTRLTAAGASLLTPFRHLSKLRLGGRDTYWNVALLGSDTDLAPETVFFHCIISPVRKELFI